MLRLRAIPVAIATGAMLPRIPSPNPDNPPADESAPVGEKDEGASLANAPTLLNGAELSSY